MTPKFTHLPSQPPRRAPQGPWCSVGPKGCRLELPYPVPTLREAEKHSIRGGASQELSPNIALGVGTTRQASDAREPRRKTKWPMHPVCVAPSNLCFSFCRCGTSELRAEAQAGRRSPITKKPHAGRCGPSTHATFGSTRRCALAAPNARRRSPVNGTRPRGKLALTGIQG